MRVVTDQFIEAVGVGLPSQTGTGSELPCRQVDPDLFFSESPQGVAAAKQVCAECPVRDLCLAGALERQEPAGVWGGELLVRGQIVAFKRGRGRPRKSEAA